MEQQAPFGVWLKQRRNALDLAQWELAEQVGCSRDTIQKIESGSRRPSKQVAELLAACLGIAPADRGAFVNWARGGGRALPISTPFPARTPVQPSGQNPPPPPSEFAKAPASLPTHLTSLIGREQEIDAVRGLVLRDDIRLVSLVGPPGVGKTRLSIAAATSVVQDLPDGVHFIPLESITEPNLVVPAIAGGLKIRPLGDQPALEAVAAHLGPRRVLLVLDNFEQVLDAGLDVVALINTCPGLKVLVTSREALHVQGEWRFAVQPLKVPDTKTKKRLDLLSRISSVALFTQRAQALQSDFALTPDNAVLVADICARLDGLPLAVELAATRVPSLSLGEVLSGLGRLELLTGNLRNLPPRQRTIRGAIDWSYHLLAPSERALFRRMAVFAGGCTLPAAEAVCGAPDLSTPGAVPAEHFLELESLRSLVEKSLLRYESGETKQKAEGRYAMLEVLREYALEQLRSSGEENDVRRRHAQYYVALAQNAFPRLNGPEQAQVLQELEAENNNIRAALKWSLDGGTETVELALRLSGALGKFWDIRGYASEGRRWLGEALKNASAMTPAAAAALPPLVRIRAMTAAGSLASIQGDLLAARSLHRQALSVARESGNKTYTGTCLLNLALVCNHLGEKVEAMALYEHALALFRELEDKPGIARTLVNMGFAARRQGEDDKARVFYEESLALRKGLGDQYGLALTLGNLGELAVHRGQHAEARACLEASRSIRCQIGDERGVAFCQRVLATLERAENHLAQACSLFQSSLRVYQKVGDQEAIAACLEMLPELCMQIGHALDGVRLWGAAEALRRTIRAPIPLAQRAAYEQAVARARAELGEAAFVGAWTEGSQMTAEDAIANALLITPNQ